VIQKNWQALIKPNKLNVEPGADSSRTATVVANADTRLMAVDSAVFLDAIGDSHRCLEKAESIVAGLLAADRRRRSA